MTLQSILSESAQYFSFLYYHIGTARWGLLIMALIVLIILLSMFIRKSRMKHVSVLIYQNRQQELRQKTTEQWEKGKMHIKELLYEMTEHAQTHESLDLQSQYLPVQSKRDHHKITQYTHAGTIIKRRPVSPRQLRKSNTPLDVQELQDVATLAKRLSSRSRQHVSS